MTIRPRALIALATLILAGVAAAAGTVAGTWNCAAFTSDGQALNFTLKIRDEGGQLSGTAESSRGAMPLIEPKLESSTLTFKVDYDGARYTLTLKVTGDKMEGTYAGESGSGKVTGTRQQ